MELGFVLDNDYGSKRVGQWVEGAPRKRWYGLNTWRLRKLNIESWRCERCGLLENYAPAS